MSEIQSKAYLVHIKITPLLIILFIQAKAFFLFYFTLNHLFQRLFLTSGN